MRKILTTKYLIPAVVFYTFLSAGCAHNADRNPLPTQPYGRPVPLPASVSPQAGHLPAESPEMPSPDENAGDKEILDNASAGNLNPSDIQGEQLNEGLGDKGHPDQMDMGADEEMVTIADPLESFNRAMFVFNDRFYFWVLKPVAQGYNMVFPEVVRVSVDNFFFNLRFPIRFVNFLLQADLKGASIESGRFGINTTVGIVGFFDPASSEKMRLMKQDTDLGLTLARYGIGHGFYIDWPVLGPSSPRDSVGMAGDYFLDPVSYVPPWYATLGIRSYEVVNDTSLRLGDYESLKEAAIDPYISLRDAYVQYRNKGMKGRKAQHQVPAATPAE